MRAYATAALIGLALAVPALATPAAAQQGPASFEVRTAADLARVCSNPGAGNAAAIDMGFCSGYGAGALDYHRAITPPGAAPLFCVPSPAPTFEEARTRYVAWVNSNPANGAMRAPDSIFAFLRATYPCPAAPARRR